MSNPATTQGRITSGRCACCGGVTDVYEEIAPGIRMCREWCITPPGRDHRDPETIRVILSEARGEA